MLSRTPDTTMQTPARASALPSGYFFFPAFGGNVLRLRCIRKKSLWTSASAADCFEPSFLFLDVSVSGASKAADLSDGALRSWSGSRATSVRGILPRPLAKVAALHSAPPPKCRSTANGISALHMPARQGSKASSPSPLNGWHALRLSSCPGAHRGTRSGNGLSPNVGALSPPRSCPGAERGRASSKQGSRSVWE